jgi:hypothetical protein
VVSVVVPVMLAVLPYARGRGFDSPSRLYCVNLFKFLFDYYYYIHVNNHIGKAVHYSAVLRGL